jgi:sphingolipid delta-4 desaturase
MQALRPVRLRVLKPIDRWVVTNVVAQVLFDGALLYFWGPKALIYMFISLMFSVGLHPLGARWIQEHYIVFPGQETADYYGPLNPLALNVGYHNEHHDFPSIPWNRLPEVKRAAPEAYDTLQYHRSWTRLLWRFIVDPEISLYSRYVREGPGESRLDEARAASQDLPDPAVERPAASSATQHA